MNEHLNKVIALVKPETLANRNEVLKLIGAWQVCKGEMIAAVQKLPMGTFEQRTRMREALDRVKILNIWPWGGALESILEHVGAPTILEHWDRCVNFAKEEMDKLPEKAA